VSCFSETEIAQAKQLAHDDTIPIALRECRCRDFSNIARAIIGTGPSATTESPLIPSCLISPSEL